MARGRKLIVKGPWALKVNKPYKVGAHSIRLSCLVWYLLTCERYVFVYLYVNCYYYVPLSSTTWFYDSGKLEYTWALYNNLFLFSQKQKKGKRIKIFFYIDRHLPLLAGIHVRNSYILPIVFTFQEKYFLFFFSFLQKVIYINKKNL